MPPDDDATSPLKRLDGQPTFDEAWQAQVLAIVDSLIANGQLTAIEWSEQFGSALNDAQRDGSADTLETYYSAALEALEHLLDQRGKVSREDAVARKNAWEQAYRQTPHGQPVALADD